MKNLILTLIITLPLTLLGQGWEQTFGGESSGTKNYGDYSYTGNSVQQTNDGGYIIAGSRIIEPIDEFDATQVILLKTDNNGNEAWFKTYGGEESENGVIGSSGGLSVIQTNDGGYVLTGCIYNPEYYEPKLFLLKTNNDGDQMWFFEYLNIDGLHEFSFGSSVQQTSDSGFIVTGVTYINDEKKIIVIKVDNNGIEQWRNFYGIGEYNDSYSIHQTNDAGYIIIGVFNSNTSYGLSNSTLLKIDENGNEEWVNTFEIEKDTESGNYLSKSGVSVLQTNDGGYIISGILVSFENFEGGRYHFLMKTDDQGNEQWTKIYDELNLAYINDQDDGNVFNNWPSLIYGKSIQQTINGDFLITGSYYIDDIPKIFILRTNEIGDVLWTQSFGSQDYLYFGNDIQKTSDGGFIILGNRFHTNYLDEDYSEWYFFNQDIVLIKTNQFGNITSTTEIQLPNPNRKIEKTVNLKGQEIKPQTNQPIIEIFDDGSVEKKIVVE